MRQARLFASCAALGCCFVLAVLPGCQKQRDLGSYDPDFALPTDDPGGYHEVRYNNAIYVLTGAPSEIKLKQGKLPATMPSRFGPQGEKVYFEAGSPAQVARLRGEYAKRHQVP